MEIFHLRVLTHVLVAGWGFGAHKIWKSSFVTAHMEPELRFERKLDNADFFSVEFVWNLIPVKSPRKNIDSDRSLLRQGERVTVRHNLGT